MSGWIVREGKVRGKGAYLRAYFTAEEAEDSLGEPAPHVCWEYSQSSLREWGPDAGVWSHERAGELAALVGGRVVRLVSREEAKRRAASEARTKALAEVRALVLRRRMGATQDSLGVLSGIVRDIDRALCPCQGPLPDPGPDHVAACPWKDENYEPPGGMW